MVFSGSVSSVTYIRQCNGVGFYVGTLLACVFFPDAAITEYVVVSFFAQTDTCSCFYLFCSL